MRAGARELENPVIEDSSSEDAFPGEILKRARASQPVTRFVNIAGSFALQHAVRLKGLSDDGKSLILIITSEFPKRGKRIQQNVDAHPESPSGCLRHGPNDQTLYSFITHDFPMPCRSRPVPVAPNFKLVEFAKRVHRIFSAPSHSWPVVVDSGKTLVCCAEEKTFVG